MAERITDVLVRRAAAGARAQLFFWDSEVKGFALRVTNKGAKSFILDYRVGGRQRRITLGSYPDWTVKAARRLAKDVKRQVSLGNDPMEERHSSRGAPTVSDLWEKYKSDHLVKKSERSQADETSMWQKLILPDLGKTKVEDVTIEQVEALHRHITVNRGTPTRANRTVEVLRKAFNLSIRWKWRADNPASGITRNPEERRQRYLTAEELGRLIGALDNHTEQASANAIKLLMLTGARRGEVLAAKWEMFDLQRGIWIKPSAHTKQKKEHRVPLSSSALTLLNEIKESSSGEFVFPGKTPDVPLTDIKRTWAAVCKSAKVEDVRIHDLRHSFASLLVNQGASLPLIGAMLGHTQVATTARYVHLYDDPLREAAELVGKAIESASN